MPPTAPAITAELRFIEMPDDGPRDVTKLELATLEKKPGVGILSAPRVTTRSGRECEIEVLSGTAGDASSKPTGVTAWLRPTLDGETVHYAMKLSVRVRQNPADAERTTVQELTSSGDAKLDLPVVVDIGKTNKGRRYLAWMVFRRADTPAERAPQ